MLFKNELPQVVDDDHWSDDKLGRKDVATKLTNIVGTINQPFVIGLNAQFGMGKTFFLQRWQRDLENAGHLAIYFNAWETDFSENPFIAFISELTAQFSKWGIEEDNANFVNLLKETGKIVAPKLAAKAMSIGTFGALSSDDILEVGEKLKDKKTPDANLLGDIAKNELATHKNAQAAIKRFREYLQKIAESALNDKKNDNPKVVVLVDELDRCRPNYAIELLENIKHFFSVPGLVFVLAVDDQQLKSCVAAAYGSESDTVGYLRRFIDWNFRLPDPSAAKFGSYLYKRFDLAKVFPTSDNLATGGHRFATIFTSMAIILGLSLREQEQCFTDVNVALRMTRHGRVPFSIVLAVLVALKSKEPELYRAFCGQDVTADQVIQRLREIKPDGQILEEHDWDMIELAFTISGVFDSIKMADRIKELRNLPDAQMDDGKTQELNKLDGIYGVWQDWNFKYHIGSRRPLAATIRERLELVSELT